MPLDDAADGLTDRLLIRELVENWVLWRDAGEWDRFATLWHDDGWMVATWFQAGATDFIAGCRRVFDAGILAQHFLGGSSIDLQGHRAVAQTKMQIIQRGEIDGVDVTVSCFGRFFDAVEKRDGRWGLVLRNPVYEIDTLTLVDPAATLRLDPDLLASFPVGYRNLAYLQAKQGFDVNRAMPGTRGPEIAALKARFAAWLDGADSVSLRLRVQT